MNIPIIDISPFLAPNSLNSSKLQTAKKVNEACSNVGFFYVVGHGVDSKQVSEILDLASEFFSLPEEEKSRISIFNNDFARGYQKLGQNITKYQKDWHEAIDYYAPIGLNSPLLSRKSPVLKGSNPFPSNPPLFQSKLESYVETMKKLGHAIMNAIALGLGLPQDYFDSKMNNSFWVLRMIGYPILGHESEDKGLSCGEHTDYGCLTILNTDDTKGALQVLSKSGEWICADPIENAFVINIGDMLNIWTNDRYKATLHRVIHTKGNFRVSIPFFYEPNFDAIISPIPEISGSALKYQSIMYGDHLLSKVENNFKV